MHVFGDNRLNTSYGIATVNYLVYLGLNCFQINASVICLKALRSNWLTFIKLYISFSMVKNGGIIVFGRYNLVKAVLVILGIFESVLVWTGGLFSRIDDVIYHPHCQCTDKATSAEILNLGIPFHSLLTALIVN